MTEEVQKESVLIKILPVVITGVFGFFGSYLLFASKEGSNQNAFLNTVLTENKRLSEENIQLAESLVISHKNNMTLVTKNALNVDKVDVIRELLNRFPYPAWIKCFDEANLVFFVCEVNEAYSIEYGKSRVQYINKEDHEVHGFELAESYKQGDFKVLNSKSFLKTLVPVKPLTGEERMDLVYKFYVPDFDKHQAVAGVAININDITEN